MSKRKTLKRVGRPLAKDARWDAGSLYKRPTDEHGKTELVKRLVQELRGRQPDPIVDERSIVDHSQRALRLMGITSGKRVTTGRKAPMDITRSPGRPRSDKPLTAAPSNRAEANALAARRAGWNAHERPARVTPRQWEALRLREVEGRGVPGAYKRMTFIKIGQRLVPPISGPKAKDLVDKAKAKLEAEGVTFSRETPT